MARGKRKVTERDYEKLISSTKECIEKLETKSVEIREELKSKKDELKKLERDFENYKIQKAEEEKQQQTQELAKLLMESGLTLDEIKEKLVKNTKKRTDRTENDKSVEKTEEQKETAQIQRIYKSLETGSYFYVENYGIKGD